MNSFGTGCKIRRVRPNGTVVREGTCSGHQRLWHGDIVIMMLPTDGSREEKIQMTASGSTGVSHMEFQNRKTNFFQTLTSTFIPGKRPARPGTVHRQESL